jgi:hypothetical protein
MQPFYERERGKKCNEASSLSIATIFLILDWRNCAGFSTHLTHEKASSQVPQACQVAVKTMSINGRGMFDYSTSTHNGEDGVRTACRTKQGVPPT